MEEKAVTQSAGGANRSMEDCVMLALSTFRKSEQAIETAIQKARNVKKLIVVYVADVNLARYFVGSEPGLLPHLKDTCEADLLKQHEKAGHEQVAAIQKRLRKKELK
jgi:hypothetical protein